MGTAYGLLDGRREILRHLFASTPSYLHVRLFINDVEPSAETRHSSLQEPWIGSGGYAAKAVYYGSWLFTRPGSYALAQCANQSIWVRHKVGATFTACTVYGWFLSSSGTTTSYAQEAYVACRLASPIAVPAAGANVVVAPYFQVAAAGQWTAWGEEYLARQFCGLAKSGNLYAGTFKNDVTPDRNTVKADLTAGSTLAAVSNAAAVEEIAGSLRVRRVVTPGASRSVASGTVYGFYLLDHDQGEVIFAQRLGSPYAVEGRGAHADSLGLWLEAV